jgi:nucleotide-binding universal stress UspA family protein
MTKTILVPIDLMHQSSYAKVLPVAGREAELHGAELIVMTVVPDVMAGVDWRYAIRGSKSGSEDYGRKEMMQQANARLAELIKTHVPATVPGKTLVRHGIIYKEILDAAADLDVDLIIIGAHRPSLKDYLLGTNAARVVRHAACSVLVMRERN